MQKQSWDKKKEVGCLFGNISCRLETARKSGWVWILFPKVNFIRLTSQRLAIGNPDNPVVACFSALNPGKNSETQNAHTLTKKCVRACAFRNRYFLNFRSKCVESTKFKQIITNYFFLRSVTLSNSSENRLDYFLWNFLACWSFCCCNKQKNGKACIVILILQFLTAIERFDSIWALKAISIKINVLIHVIHFV